MNFTQISWVKFLFLTCFYYYLVFIRNHNIMEKNLDKALNDFLGEEELEETKKKNYKNVILDEREGLIERVDKIFVDKDGRQLLREVY